MEPQNQCVLPRVIMKTREEFGSFEDELHHPGDPFFAERDDLIDLKHHADENNLVKNGRRWRANSAYVFGLHLLAGGESVIGWKLVKEIVDNQKWVHSMFLGEPVVYDEVIPPAEIHYERVLEDGSILPIGVVVTKFELPLDVEVVSD